MPLPEPNRNDSSVRDYKLQFTFDHDRFVTPWLAILGRRAPSVPMLEVHLTRAGEELISVEARVMPLKRVLEGPLLLYFGLSKFCCNCLLGDGQPLCTAE